MRFDVACEACVANIEWSTSLFWSIDESFAVQNTIKITPVCPRGEALKRAQESVRRSGFLGLKNGRPAWLHAKPTPRDCQYVGGPVPCNFSADALP